MKTSCKFLPLDCRLCVFYVSFQLKRNAFNVLRKSRGKRFFYFCCYCTCCVRAWVYRQYNCTVENKSRGFRFENALRFYRPLIKSHLFAPQLKSHGTRFHIVYPTLTYRILKEIRQFFQFVYDTFTHSRSQCWLWNRLVANFGFAYFYCRHFLPDSVSTHAYAVIVQSFRNVLPFCVLCLTKCYFII